MKNKQHIEIPDKWLIIRIKDIYKVFATYLGGYGGSDSWRLNSGISSVTEEGNYYIFNGYSGSQYKCHKRAYGSVLYTQSVLDDVMEKAKKQGIDMEVLPSETPFLDLVK